MNSKISRIGKSIDTESRLGRVGEKETGGKLVMSILKLTVAMIEQF